MIVSSKAVIILQKESRYKAELQYTLDDGRVIERGSGIFVASQKEADKLLADRAPLILEKIQKSDALEAVQSGISSAHKQATLTQVQYAWLKAGFDEQEPYKSYLLMKDVAPALLALRYTDEQYAAAFNATVEEVQNAKNKWTVLSADAATLTAYAGVVN